MADSVPKRPDHRDTIAAIATAPGLGGVGILRISGLHVPKIAEAVIGRLPQPRHATLCRFLDANQRPVDQGLALYFPAPASFTGEHVLELHGHGGPVVLDLLLQTVLVGGARLARPGEFTERAFLNGKLDLAQAEAVADLIGASSAAAARAALNSLAGRFSDDVQQLLAALIQLRTRIEADLDFPDEDIDSVAADSLIDQIRALANHTGTMIASARQGALLRDGMTVVLAGRPNAGKSSLMNALAARDTAIVSATAGTTRDILREQINLNGLPLHLLDTAGLRDSVDDIEAEGVRRAVNAMQSADRALLLVDDSQPNDASDEAIGQLRQQIPAGLAVTLVRNKIDLSGRKPGLVDDSPPGLPEIALSALDGRGIEDLRDHLKACMGYQPVGEGGFTARRRHLDSLEQCRRCLEQAVPELAARRPELAAEQLRLAQLSVGQITGEFTSDDLLGRIFSSFCIGK